MHTGEYRDAISNGHGLSIQHPHSRYEPRTAMHLTRRQSRLVPHIKPEIQADPVFRNAAFLVKPVSTSVPEVKKLIRETRSGCEEPV